MDFRSRPNGKSSAEFSQAALKESSFRQLAGKLQRTPIGRPGIFATPETTAQVGPRRVSQPVVAELTAR